MATGRSLPTSRHFQLHELADGIYAAIAKPGTGSGSNAGIIDLGEQVLIFDTFLTPQAATDLRAAAEQLTGRPARLVINSHWHGDHTQGNQVFAAETTILATNQTRELMETRGTHSIERQKTSLPAELQKLEDQLQQEPDEQKRAKMFIELEIGEVREIAESIDALTLRLPDQTFEERELFQGTRRTAALLTYGGGHTASDAFLVIPAERLAFMGDLLFVQSHLWIGDGNPQEWRYILKETQQLDLRVCVPGHGPIGSPADFPAVVDYLAAVEEIVSDALDKGTPAEEAAATPAPAVYTDWVWSVGWSANIQTLIEQARKS